MSNWLPFIFIACGVGMFIAAVLWGATLIEYRRIKQMGYPVPSVPAFITAVFCLFAAAGYTLFGVALWLN